MLLSGPCYKIFVSLGTGKIRWMLMLVVSNGTIATCSAMLLIFKQVLSEFLRKKEEKMQFYPQLITLSAFSSYLQGEHGNTSLLPHSGGCSFLVKSISSSFPSSLHRSRAARLHPSWVAFLPVPSGCAPLGLAVLLILRVP